MIYGLKLKTRLQYKLLLRAQDIPIDVEKRTGSWSRDSTNISYMVKCNSLCSII